MGLYFSISIVPFYILGIAIYLSIKKFFIKNDKPHTVKKLKLVSGKRYFRYIKLILNKKVIFYIIIFSIISNTIVIFQNKNYKTLYEDGQTLNEEAIIVGEKEEKPYYNRYKIKLSKTNKYLYLQVNKKYKNTLEYGDKIKFCGNFVKPNSKRNYGGFSYEDYLRTLKIYGTIKAENIEILEKNKANFVFTCANKISSSIKQKIDFSLEEEEASILKGILLGDTSQIEEDIQENFRISSISHILAVSGMHVTYLIAGINMLFKNKLGKRKTEILVIIFLIFYMFITGFSPSVVRAGIMGILLVGSKLLYRKNDTCNSLAISLFLILIYNPFLITNIGLQFSYIGTLGMIILNRNILKFLRNIKIKNRKWKYRFNRKIIIATGKIKEIVAITISVQLAIFPVMLYHFNLFGTYFIITNLLVSAIIGPILIISSITIIASFIFPVVTTVFFVISKIGIKLLAFISNFGELPFSKIYIQTPKIWMILLYYSLILTINFIYPLYNSKKLTTTEIRVRNLIALFKYKIIQNKKKCFKILAIVIIIILTFYIFPKKLSIYFVDVGQGDCTFIKTPHNKTILIDGGGSLTEEYNVGKSTLLPYILDRGYRKIDYIFISHFDQDHVRRNFIFVRRNKGKKHNYR